MADKDTTEASPSSEAYPSSWSPRATRVLQVAVVVMGILIVIGFVIVVFTIVSRMGGDEGAEAPAVRVGDPQISRMLGPDAEVISTETDSGRLAVTVRSGEGVRVILIDMRSGEIISVIGAE